MLSYSESLRILKETEALLEGHFILSSGLHSNRYVQCAKLLSLPKKAEIVCVSLVEKIKSNFGKIDIVLSPAIGGIVVGYVIGKHLNTQTIFAERVEDKLSLRRGFSIPKNSKVLVVEDVVTTGKSALECSKIVIENEARLIGYACIIDRSNNELLIKDRIISQIKINIPVYDENDLPNDLKKTTAVKPGSRNLAE